MCTSCGQRFVGNGGCPACGGLAKSSNDDMLRKTFDEPDLKKGGF